MAVGMPLPLNVECSIAKDGVHVTGEEREQEHADMLSAGNKPTLHVEMCPFQYPQQHTL